VKPVRKWRAWIVTDSAGNVALDLNGEPAFSIHSKHAFSPSDWSPKHRVQRGTVTVTLDSEQEKPDA
jgi:hypothetical protein